MFLIQLFIWGLALAFSVIPGIFIGVLVQSMLGDWAYWPGYIGGTLAFLYHMRPILFLDADIPVPEPKECKSTLIPLIIGLLIGLNIGDD